MHVYLGQFNASLERVPRLKGVVLTYPLRFNDKAEKYFQIIIIYCFEVLNSDPPPEVGK